MRSTRILGLTMVGALLTSNPMSAAAQATGKHVSAQQATGQSNVQLVAQYSTDRLKDELNLTEDQIPKVEKINLATAEALKKTFDKYAADTTSAADAALARGLVNTLRSNQTQLKGVLTPSQWAVHQQHKSERLAQNQTAAMTYDLSLTRSQILEVQRINQEAANNLMKTLDQPMGASKPTHQAMLEAAKPVIAARDTALSKVLSADQWMKMQNNRRAFRDLLMQEATASPTPAPAAAAPKPKP